MTYTEDDVERVGKALQDYNAEAQAIECIAAGYAVPDSTQFKRWDDLAEHEREYVRGVARAALAAMPDGREAALEEAAKVAETLRTLDATLPTGPNGEWEQKHVTKHGVQIAAAIRSLKAQPAATGWNFDMSAANEAATARALVEAVEIIRRLVAIESHDMLIEDDFNAARDWLAAVADGTKGSGDDDTTTV